VADPERLWSPWRMEDILVRRAVAAVREQCSPHGFNLGMNLGRVAGAGIAGHVQLDLVPRRGGDTCFMPFVGQSRVLPELVAETDQRPRPHLAARRPSAAGPPSEPL
jgi:ATP adenylyltransferase